jgi:hypothetical protein
MSKSLKQQTISKGQKPVQHVVHASTQSNPPSKRKQPFNHNPFRRPWRLLTPSPSRLRSRSRSRPPQQLESDDQESMDDSNHLLPHQHQSDDNSSEQEVMEK